MKYRPVLFSSQPASVLCLGSATFGSGLDRASSYALLDAFLAQGGNFIDTAHVYGAWLPGGLGLSETIVGDWLKERGTRDQVIIATKGAHPDLSSMHIPRLSRQEILADLEDSLRCLRTEVIDLYWLHRDDPQQPVAEILETLLEQVTSGKIRAFGCSNWRRARIAEALDYAARQSWTGFIGNQLLWSFAEPNREAIVDRDVVTMDPETFAFHQKTGLFVAAYTSQAHGFFSRISHDPSSLPEHLRVLYSNEENARRLHRLQEVARDLSLTLSAVTLAYLIHQPIVTFPIIGASSIEQLLESLQAGDIELDPGIVQYLEKGR